MWQMFFYAIKKKNNYQETGEGVGSEQAGKQQHRGVLVHAVEAQRLCDNKKHEELMQNT